MIILVLFFPYADALLELLVRHSYPVLFLLLFAEESGLPLPLPGDVTMMFAGYRVSVGHLRFVPAFAAMEAGTLVGSTVLWWLGRRGGRPLVYRYGRYIGLNDQRLSLTERWFAQHGSLSVVVGRLTPGLRIITSFVSGVEEVPFRVFLPSVAVASSVYIIFFMFVGFGLGEETWRVARGLWLHPLMWIPVAVIVGGVIALALRLRPRLRALWDRAKGA